MECILINFFQVESVEDVQNLVYLKLIPRIDYSRPRGVLRSSQNNPVSVNLFSCIPFNYSLLLFYKLPHTNFEVFPIDACLSFKLIIDHIKRELLWRN